MKIFSKKVLPAVLASLAMSAAALFPAFPVFATATADSCANRQEAARIILDPDDPVNDLPVEDLPAQTFIPITDEQRPWQQESTPENTPVDLDDRTLVKNTTVFPYSAICKLHLYYYDEENKQLYHFIGSGFLITPDTILTCAHCVYDVQHGYGKVRRIIITPGSSSVEKPYGTLDSGAGDVSEIVYDPVYPEKGSSTHDCALIRLNTPVGNQTGYIRLNTAGMGAGELRLSGYPSMVRNVHDDENQYEATGRALETFDRRMDFSIAGSGGQSGSPVMNASNEAVAIFAYGYAGYPVNGGTLIDTDRVEFIAENSDMETPVYRAYNPNSGEHFYTTNFEEFLYITGVGWEDEGLAWRSSDEANGIPVYRLYDPNRGDHHYTSDRKEYDALEHLGWKKEDIAWYAPKGEYYSHIYRLYNPNTKVGQHHFTTNVEERNALVSFGWRSEGSPFNAR